jgi:hypothetical protein
MGPVNGHPLIAHSKHSSRRKPHCHSGLKPGTALLLSQAGSCIIALLKPETTVLLKPGTALLLLLKPETALCIITQAAGKQIAILKPATALPVLYSSRKPHYYSSHGNRVISIIVQAGSPSFCYNF